MPRVLVAFLSTAAMSTTIPAYAGFTGPYAPSQWATGNQTFGCGSSEVDTSGMPDTLILLTSTGCSNIATSYRLTDPIPVSGTFTFNWNYVGIGAHHTGSYLLDGVETVLANGNGTAAGSITLPVTAGQSFKFQLVGGSSVSLMITNFMASVPAPTVFAVPIMPAWAKGVLVLLLAAAAFFSIRGPASRL